VSSVLALYVHCGTGYGSDPVERFRPHPEGEICCPVTSRLMNAPCIERLGAPVVFEPAVGEDSPDGFHIDVKSLAPYRERRGWTEPDVSSACGIFR
jgi:hypothetical protein